MTPRRIQLSRARGYRKPEGAIVVSRPSVFGNPFAVNATTTREQAVARYRDWIVNGHGSMATTQRHELRRRLPELRGHDLACWCPLPEPGEPDVCHAAVLLELANAPKASDWI